MYIQKNGNSKLKGIPIFSLPPKITCIGSTPLCRKYCYGNKSWIYPNVRKRRLENLEESKKPSFVREMVNKIKSLNAKYFRIHETGDFYSQRYLNKWIKIMKQLPNVKFLIFTKSFQLNWSEALKLKNAIIYWSVFPDSENIPKEGRYAYIIGDKEEFNYKVPGNARICPYPYKTCDQCMRCFTAPSKNLIWHLH